MWIRRRFEIAVTLAALLVAGDTWAEPPAKAGATSDPLAAYRERFQLGMSEYRAGAVANAIADWEPVYLALGPREGYRVAYDLGVAYLQVGDATLAAERLQSFLDEVRMRRESGATVSALVTREEGDARARIAELVGTNAPAHGDASSDVAPPPSAPTPNESASETTAAPAPATPAQAQAPASSAPETFAPVAPAAPLLETRVRHPVSPPILLASGALAAVAVAVTVPLGIHTFSLHSRFVEEEASTGSISASDRQNFDETRTAYDVALGSAIAFGVLTTVLTTWYFAGSSRESIPIEPVVAHERGGASLALKGKF